MAVADLSRLLDLAAIQAERGLRSLKQFTKDVWHLVEPATPFVDGWVIDALCEHLEAVTYGHIRKVVVNIPPRHTKSTLIAVIWPVWDWLHVPEDRFLCGSYSLDLSTRDNRRKRNLIEDPWFQERYGDAFQITSDQNTKRFFENDQKGYQMAVSVDGATTGHGGSKLVLDDPHNAAEAYSEADREAALRWFREVWTNRLNDQNKDCMVVVGQRIHEYDVCGYILKERPDWTHLNLPAEYEPTRKCFTSIGWSDPRKHEGELLWPQRFSKEALDGLKRDLGSTGYAAQYQQSPVPSSGGQFKRQWFRYFEESGEYYLLHTGDTTAFVAKRKCSIFAVNDPAISEKQEADYTVIQIWAKTPDKELLLLAQVRAHLDNPQQVQTIEQLHVRWHWHFIAVESVFYALALYQQLKKKGIPVKEYKPVRDKVARASVAAIKMEAGDMYFLMGADYLPELEPEVLKFPKDAHDDQVDCLSMAADLVTMVKTMADRIDWAKRYTTILQGPAGDACPQCGAEMIVGEAHVCQIGVGV
jgi:predicted phage terminase large subunit-like protein